MPLSRSRFRNERELKNYKRCVAKRLRKRQGAKLTKVLKKDRIREEFIK